VKFLLLRNLVSKDCGVYAITGITGKVGGIVARTLLATGLQVRAVVRDDDKGRPWADKGCEVAIASIAEADGLTKAFSGVDGVFFMTPPDFDPEPGFPKTREAIAAIRTAISAVQPAKVVFLSTVGAQVAEFSLLNNSKITEEGPAHRSGSRRLSTRRLVHGECQLGGGSGEGRVRSLFPAAVGPSDSDGGDG